MRIDSSGFITQKFTSNNSSSAEGLFINNLQNTTGNNASLIFSNDSGNRKKAAISLIDTGKLWLLVILIFAVDGADYCGELSLANDEKMRIDSSGRLLLGTSTARAVGGESNPVLHIEGSGNTSNSWVNLTRFQAGTASANFQFAKSRSATPGTYTIVQDGDSLGQISFLGSDGTDMANYAATIQGQVDGTPGSNDMPGRLVFSTTADGAGTVTERMRIDSSGNIGIGTTSPTFAAGTGLEVQRAGVSTIRCDDTAHSTAIEMKAANGATALAVPTNHPLLFETNGSERMRVDSSGRVYIANSGLSATAEADDLVIGNLTGGHGLTIHSQNNEGGFICFGDTDTTGTDSRAGVIRYQHSDNSMRFATNGNK